MCMDNSKCSSLHIHICTDVYHISFCPGKNGDDYLNMTFLPKKTLKTFGQQSGVSVSSDDRS